MELGELFEPMRKRLRTSHACDICRARKIRCDGNRPCASCSASDQDCVYGSDANSRGKSDLILEGITRIEKRLNEINTTITLSPLLDRGLTLPSLPSLPSLAVPASSGSFSASPASYEHSSVPGHDQHPRTPVSEPHHPGNAGFENAVLENAVLDSMHTSNTESVLQWPHFDCFPSLRNDYVSVFQLEQARPSLKTRSKSICPYLGLEDVDSILDSFEHTVNFWYPTLSRSQLEMTRDTLASGMIEEDSTVACLSLLVMALGCASEAVSGLTSGAPFMEGEAKRRASRRELGAIYFDGALRKLHTAHMEVSSVATHCLFFAAVYFAFLRRPLQAWEHISAASTKCLLLLSYPPVSDTGEDQERIRRIFWSCYILESDYLAELSALPQSRIAKIESSVPLPGAYCTHSTASEEEQSSLYFLACVSMRRLLNRVHHLLYARTTGAALDRASFPYVVAELDHQLDEWRDVLPAAFSFSIDRDTTATEAGGFLRQRYLTCRSVIYRPYLMWMLSGSGSGGNRRSPGAPSQDELKNCKACLDACLLHILDLRGFAQTVLVDTWICSMSMAGAMLVLLAACRMPSLRVLLEPEILSAGYRLKQLFGEWQVALGEPSCPSVDQSLGIISEADRFIRESYGQPE